MFVCREYVICPVEFTHELSALKKRRGILKVEHLTVAPRGGNGADDETTRRAVEGHGEKITWIEAAEIAAIGYAT
jgi:hypothetical protein